MSDASSPVVIGIAGGTGSGKTTVADVILDRAGAENIALLPHDAYYKDLTELPQAQRDLVNFDHPESLETALLVEHLRKLLAGGMKAITLSQNCPTCASCVMSRFSSTRRRIFDSSAACSAT